MKLFYFTFCYPFGSGEQWKANELKTLITQFDEITVIPYFYGGNFDHPKQLPEGVTLAGPLFNEIGLPGKKSDLFRIISHQNAPAFLKEFFQKKVYKSKKHLQSWVGSTLNAMRLLKHPVIKEIIRNANKQTVLYFYWGKGSVEMLPFIDTAKFKKTFVKMHRFDLFEYVNDNYIPYREVLLNKISDAAPSSQAGKDHLLGKYPDAKARIEVFRCGTVGNGKVSAASADNVFRVVSCSGLSTVKRVNLMIEALQYIDFPVKWTHVGDGSLSAELRELSSKLNVSDKFIFHGTILSEDVINFYTDNTFDLFVNTSSSEGVPFSIMEAFAAGIPVMATNVGGTGEIVDDHVGKLLDADISPRELAADLKEFYQLSAEQKKILRKNAVDTYFEKCDAEILARELGNYLLSEN